MNQTRSALVTRQAPAGLSHPSSFLLPPSKEDFRMRAMLAHSLQRLARWLDAKAAPAVLTGGQWSGPPFADAFKRSRTPTPHDLMAELKNTAFTCATINAAVCAPSP